MEGDSFRRQTALAQRYAADHGLDLDESLTFHDLGVSAYRGANADAGRLADFKEAVRVGLVPQGSYLLVEALDRLSRLTPRKALRVLEDIMELGIVVVTLNDGKEYTLESVERDPVNLLLAILYFIRANEESATKGRRIKAAWEGKRLMARDRPLTSVAPAWLSLDKTTQKFTVDERKAEIVRNIFARINAGVGLELIAKDLNESGTAPFGRGQRWYRSYVQKIRDNPAVIGTFVPHQLEHSSDGKVRKPLEPITGYFPAIIDEEAFYNAQALAKGKAPTTKAAKGIRSLLAGLASCPVCNGTMTRVSKGPTAKAGKPYLVCTKAKQGGGCQYRAVRLDKVEPAVWDALDSLLTQPPLAETKAEQERQAAQDLAMVLSDEIEGVLTAIAIRPVATLLNRLEDLQTRLADANAEVRRLEDEALLGNQKLILSRIDGLREALPLGPAGLPKVNALMRQLFRRVVVDYEHGFLHFHWHQGEVTTLTYEWTEDTP